MTVQPYMHVALLVHDLEGAVARFHDVLGLTFTPPTVAHVHHMQDQGRVEPKDIRVVYSKEGPPYYELIETQADGIYGRQHGEGLHHIGMWEPDCEQRLSSLKQLGLEPEAVQYTPEDRIIVAYFQPSGLHGMRLEILDQARQASMEEWIRGGEFVD